MIEDKDFDIHSSGADENRDYENVLRPLSFSDFKGQNKIVIFYIELCMELELMKVLLLI